MTPHVNNQHTIPKCYLKNFSEDGVNIYRKHKRRDKDETRNRELDKPISLKSATTRDNFYTVKSGRDPMLIETLVYSKEVENYYPKYYEMLVNPKIVGLPTMEDRTRLLMFLLSLHCRTPKQFDFFFKTVPAEFNHEIDQIKEDYKGAHLLYTLTNFIAAHEFKIFKVATISDTSEFITSDNPVLIVNSEGELLNHKFEEQFNSDNKIIIPLDKKNCCILTDATDKNGVSINGKLFYNKIDRITVDCSFTQNINYRMLGSADNYYFGSENYLKAYFSLFKLA